MVRLPAMRRVLTCLLLCCLTGCVQPQLQHTASNATRAPDLNPVQAVMEDGYTLPLSMQGPAVDPRAVILALHGFNDYRNAFQAPAADFARHGILTVAYDQRGFGATGQRGLWPGMQRLRADAYSLAALLCARYPGVPLYLLGESMGGAVVIELLQHDVPDCVTGAVLVAPAVWGWQTMPWWQQLALRVAVHLFPSRQLTGEGLHIRPSDNIEMLRALGRDPLVIKATRIDTIYGLTNLMDAAASHAGRFRVPVLLLYGARDEVIPPQAMCPYQQAFLAAAPDAQAMILYPQGYHMLTRDLQATRVLADIDAWIEDRTRPPPSGFQVRPGAGALLDLCAGITVPAGTDG